jgi:nicotinamidase-related amidase
MNRFLFLLLHALGTSVAATDSPGGDIPAARESAPTVLLVIDVQHFYFPGGRVPLAEPVTASLHARRLLDHFRTNRWPVVHVQHLPIEQTTPSPDSGDPPYRIHPNVLPSPGEPVIGKHHANAFRDTELLVTLRRFGAKRLVICGMQTHMCVEAATRAAADLGFEVIVAHDACATRSLKFMETEVPAAQVHAAALAAMNGPYARVVSTDDVLAGLK